MVSCFRFDDGLDSDLFAGLAPVRSDGNTFFFSESWVFISTDLLVPPARLKLSYAPLSLGTSRHLSQPEILTAGPNC